MRVCAVAHLRIAVKMIRRQIAEDEYKNGNIINSWVGSPNIHFDVARAANAHFLACAGSVFSFARGSGAKTAARHRRRFRASYLNAESLYFYQARSFLSLTARG